MPHYKVRHDMSLTERESHRQHGVHLQNILDLAAKIKDSSIKVVDRTVGLSQVRNQIYGLISTLMLFFNAYTKVRSRSDQTDYDVDLQTLSCGCVSSEMGAICSHVRATARKFGGEDQ